jgi:hypothetical protein
MFLGFDEAQFRMLYDINPSFDKFLTSCTKSDQTAANDRYMVEQTSLMKSFVGHVDIA